MEREMIDPWGTRTFEKYENLYRTFGIEPVSTEVKEFFKDSYFFERGLIVGYRDFDKILKQIRDNGDFILVTGFASSGEFHLGHKVIIDIYNYFRKFTKRGYFLICDIDAYVSRPDDRFQNLKNIKEYAINNIANTLALGVRKEDIYVQSKQTPEYFTFSHMVSKKLTLNAMKSALGHNNLGKFSACYLQISDILYPQLKEGVLPTFVPVGIDQEPIVRLTRDVAQRFSKQFGFELPSSINLAHLPSLNRYEEKMSKSKEGSAILLTEKKDRLNKMIDMAFTGGRDKAEEQRKFGGRPQSCPIYSVYKFHNPDSNFVNNIGEMCRKGELLCKEDKSILKEFLEKLLEEHVRKYNKFVETAVEIMENSNMLYSI